MLLFDAQTSGGLLIAIPADQVGTFDAEMKKRGAPWWRVGEVGAQQDGVRIVVGR